MTSTKAVGIAAAAALVAAVALPKLRRVALKALLQRVSEGTHRPGPESVRNAWPGSGVYGRLAKQVCPSPLNLIPWRTHQSPRHPSGCTPSCRLYLRHTLR